MGARRRPQRPASDHVVVEPWHRRARADTRPGANATTARTTARLMTTLLVGSGLKPMATGRELSSTKGGVCDGETAYARVRGRVRGGGGGGDRGAQRRYGQRSRPSRGAGELVAPAGRRAPHVGAHKPGEAAPRRPQARLVRHAAHAVLADRPEPRHRG